MKSKVLLLVMSGLTLAWGAGVAQAGVLRAAAKGIGKGSETVVKSTPDAVSDAADGVATAGKATGSAVKTGATATCKGAAAAPGIVARGAAGGAKAVWKAIW